MKTINTNNSISTLFLIFFISTLIFPTLIINKLIFILIIGISILNIKTERVITIAPIIIFFIFLFGYINSFSNNVDKDLSLQFFLSVTVLFLIYPIKKYYIDLDRIIKISGLLMSVYTLVFALMIVIYKNDSLLNIFSTYNSGGYGMRDFSNEGLLSFHLGAVPFLYLPTVLFTNSFLEHKKKRDLIALLILLFVIFLSASRGLMLICAISAGYIVYKKVDFKIKLIILVSGIFILACIGSYLIKKTNVFDPNEFSNNIKIGHFESFIENINLKNFFIGDGLASYYFSKGVGKNLAHTEITPVDMLRYLGFFLTPILYLLIIFPFKDKKYYVNNGVILFIFILYVINSLTNPTMFNSYGLLVVLWYWYKLIYSKNLNKEWLFSKR